MGLAILHGWDHFISWKNAMDDDWGYPHDETETSSHATGANVQELHGWFHRLGGLRQSEALEHLKTSEDGCHMAAA